MSSPSPPTALHIATLRRAGRLAEAEAAARQSLRATPGDGALWNELGHVLKARHNLPAAEAAFRRALELGGPPLEARLNLAVLLAGRDADLPALEQLEAARALAPDDALVLSNLGALERKLGRLEAALALLQRSVALAADRGGAQMNLGLVLADQGRIAEALPHLERAVELAPRELFYHHSLLLQMHYVSLPAERVAAAHRRYGEMAAALFGPPAPLPPRDRSPERRLRVGLVSPDLRRHPVAYFVEPLLAHRDPSRLELVAYSGAVREDEVTARLRGHCVAWRHTNPLSDQMLVEQVRSDGIDVLIDLAGHTAGNRLPVFARRAAPLQMSYLGYPDTTGLLTMDYRLTDAWADPPSAVASCDPGGAGERLLRLDDGFLFYAPPAPSPDVAPPPTDAGLPLTFGSFNALNKLSDEILALWGRLLAAVPAARLLLKHARLSDAPTRDRLGLRLDEHGIGAERRLLIGFTPALHDHLAAYRAVDIALDTFPYHGTTTTCDALWMGVPVVSLAGATHVSRVGVSLLQRAGQGELVAATPDAYVELARALAGDRPRLRALRASARERLQRGGLVDGKRGAATFERALRGAWRDYVGAG